MDIVSFYSVIMLAIMVGVLGGVLLACYEDGKPHGLWYKLKCRLKLHIFRLNGIQRIKCQHCGVPRPGLHLKAIDGGAKSDKSIFYL